ncbi:MAG: MBL fold metallo-hydrolase [Acidimicrobiia bacterium]
MAGIERLDAILLSHAHRDAAGGMARLRAWWRQRALPPIPVLAHPVTIAILGDRFARLEHCVFQPIIPGERRDQRPWPSRRSRYPTIFAFPPTPSAWRRVVRW